MINCIPFRKACTGLPEGMHLISEKCALCKRNIHNDRELYVLLERAVEEKTFDELASELNIGYKGVAAIYYRAIKKIRDRMRR